MKLITLSEKILIAGANGMAGNAIYHALKKSGYGNPKYNGKFLNPSRNELDFSDYSQVKDFFKKHQPSVVIIAVAKVGGIYANKNYPTDFILDNLKIQTNIIENAWKNGVKRLLFLGSSCIYPKFASQPLKEESLLTSSLEDTNEYYAIAKIAGLKLCAALRKQHNFDTICLMPTNLYGKGDNYHIMNSHVFAALIRRFYEAVENNSLSVKCWGSGNPRREFMNVEDLGSAAVFALESWNPEKEHQLKKNQLTMEPLTYLNVGTGIDISIKDLAEMIASKFNYKGDIIWDKSKPDGTPVKVLDVSRINSLGWEAKIDLETGLENTIKFFKENYASGNLRL